jgi:hypothetical protein
MERTIEADLERDLAQYGAVVLAKKMPVLKATSASGAPNPEAGLFVTGAMIALPAVIPLAQKGYALVRGWWERRQAKKAAAGGDGA